MRPAKNRILENVMRVELYTTPEGKSPVEKILKTCTPSQETKILRQLQYIQEFGLTPAIPNLKKIKETPLWELRILGKDNIRILCAQIRKEVIVVFHIFVKKKMKTPKREIILAMKRYQQEAGK